MKTPLTIFAIVLVALTSFAQQGINYKALIKDGSGNVVANDLIQVQFIILDGADNVYEETHSPTTDDNGIVILNIGEGTPVGGSNFSLIDWSSNNHFLNVQVNTGSGLQDMGTSAFKTVPYAKVAEVVKNPLWTKNGDDIYRTIGSVGIGTSSPDSASKLHVGGNLFVQSNLGDFKIGFPENGNRWSFATISSGANLLFRSKPDGSNTYTTQFRMLQDGEFQLGTTSSASAWMHIRQNSTIDKALLKLEEVGNDYARLELTNSTSIDSYWHVAGLPSSTASSARLNFYFRNASGAADKLTITGDGEVGINGSPTARLEIFQRSQTVGTGLRFDDGTANSDWDITHGYALRFHYGGNLRGFINAITGAYTQSSDISLKSNIQNMNSTLDHVKQLSPKTYYYNDDKLQTKVLGFIAQEVEPIFPEVVHYSEPDGLYGIDYGAFGVIAIKAIQEQQTIIENQQNQIDELKILVQSLIEKQ